MQLKKHLLSKLPTFAMVLFALGLTSCGSYQYVGQNNDGVYGEDERQEDVVRADAEDSGDNTYYKNYFKEKSLEMGSDRNEEVFVDIDSYEGSYSEDYVQEEDVNTGYGAWGENNSDVSINIYNNGFNNYWNRPYYGWNRYGWNRPYSGWNLGFGGYGHYYSGYQYGGIYDPFWSPGFGYGYGYGAGSYYGGYYGGNGYGRNSLSYNSTRRGSTYGRNSVLGRRVEGARRSSSTSTRTRTSSTPRTRATTPRVRTNNSTPRVRTSTPRVRSNNSSTPRVRTTTPRTRTRTTTPRTSTPRTSSPSRSSTRSSSGSSSRSSSGSRGRG
ncbi:hypothetical protein [Lacinutrix mariniflava]|uniref:hypothetical protein n=1 Tax=Lacinutrix mariniflava TaxID=342955 RepID=UPI0006E16934|nr:hypothetical protein [Lacinutrix mariniflava]